MSASSPLWGALFDWDGVIIDSALQHEESWERLAKDENLILPQGHFRRGFGMKNEKIIPELLKWTSDPSEIKRLSLRKEALYRDIVEEKGLSPLPGVRPWLERLRVAGIPCAVGSSTHRANIDLSLRLMKLESFFQCIVTSEDVTHGKPHPEVFLTGAKRIGLPPNKCVVFEDAHVGIQAALAGGMKVIGVATTHQANGLPGAHKVVHRLDELNVKDLESWFG